MSYKKLDEILSQAVSAGVLPGAVAIVANGHDVLYQGAFGTRAVGGAEPVTTDAVFWIASQTKAITSAAAMQLVERGRCALDEPVAVHLPELRNPQVLTGFGSGGEALLRPARREITLRHLLSHTAGFTYDLFSSDMVRYQEQHGIAGATGNRKILSTPLVADPGDAWVYGIGTDWVGQLIERVTDSPLDEYLDENVLAPLGMTDTSFLLKDSQRARLMSLHARGADGRLSPLEFETPQEPDFLSGGAGLYSTGHDYIRFQQMILRRGKASNGTAILQPDTVDQMARSQIGDLAVTRLEPGVPAFTNAVDLLPGIPKKWSLAFMVSAAEAPSGRSAGSLSWAGIANTHYWIDPKKNVAALLLTQVIPFADADVLHVVNDFENAVYDGIAER